MKKLFLLVAFVIAGLSGCDSLDPLPDGAILSQVAYTSGNQTWLELYAYNDAGQLISVEEQNGLGRKKSFVYSGDRLVETATVRLDNGILIFRDSLGYNAAGQVVKIYGFSINSGDDVPLSQIKSLSYNNQGQLVEVSSEFINLDGYQPRDTYTWQNDNVVQVNHYNGDELEHEFYLTYDDKLSVNLESHTGIGYPEAATRNNVISVDWNDYTGLLDTACKPCTTTYQYSANGLPTAFTTNWSYAATFSYK
jgi:hypothetical protein